MAGSCILRRLRDEDLEAVHHLMRRDALSDLRIGKEAEARYGQALSASDKALSEIVRRYRSSAAYTRWLERWESEGARVRERVAEQQRRVDVLADAVRRAAADGVPESAADRVLDRLSDAVMGRLLALAAEASDEELREGVEGRGWVANVLRQAGALRGKGQGASGTRDWERGTGKADAALTPEAADAKRREIFGLPPAAGNAERGTRNAEAGTGKADG